MKAAFVALALWFSLSGLVNAQKVGEPLADNEGVAVQLDGSHSLNVRIVDHRMRVIFLDEKSLVERCPFQRVSIRVERTRAQGDDISLVMRPKPDVPYVEHARFIKPPYTFRIHIVLYPNEDSDEGKVSIPIMRINSREESQ